MVPAIYEILIPVEAVEKSLTELGEGVRVMIDSSVGLWRAKRMTSGDLECMLKSVVWQSPTLEKYFESAGRKKRRSDDVCETLSSQDMMALLMGQSEEDPSKKARLSVLTANEAGPPAQRRPAETAFEVLSEDDMMTLMGLSGQCDASGSMMSTSVQKEVPSFDNLVLSNLDEDSDLSDIGATLFKLGREGRKCCEVEARMDPHACSLKHSPSASSLCETRASSPILSEEL
jgi:hypothetical protein